MTDELQQAAASLLIVGFPGQTVGPELHAQLKRGAGGVILFSRNLGDPVQTAELINELQDQRRAEAPLLMSVDQEGGRVARLKPPVTQFPEMAMLGSIGDESLAERVGTVLAHELARLGFNLNFAPVMDVATNSANPVIGHRALSSDPYEVARLGVAVIRGMQRHGLMACAKHFPGHGDTSADSHLELPVISHDIDRFRAVELVPFEAAVRAGVSTIMTAHVCYNALEPGVPATLSVKVVEGLLRRQMGYRGVVISDDLEMKAVLDNFGIEESVRRGLAAGVDAFLICQSSEYQDEAFEALLLAAESSSMMRNRLLESAARISRLREAMSPYCPVAPESVRHFLGTAEHREVVETILRKGDVADFGS